MRRPIAVLVVLVTTLAAGSTALAYFRTIGSGSGPATAGNTQPVTLTSGTPTAALYPAGQADVALTVDNPNLIAVRIGSLSLSTGQGTAGFGVDGGHAGCATSVLSFTTQTNAGAGWTVPAKVGSTDGSLSIDLANALAMSASAASACQGGAFTVYLSAGP